jgi:outer membrane protein
MKLRQNTIRQLAVVALAACWSLQASEAPVLRPISVVVANYVSLGLAGNLALANQSLEADKSLATLREARARFFPELSLNARYTSNSGGRQIDFPVSQLLNPAYQTLNELLVANGQAARFPSVTDSSFPFLRTHEQDTHLALRQPLFAPGLADSVAAARAGASATAFGREALARELARDITRAYLDTEKARSAAAIVDSSLTLLAENLRVNESLYTNGKITQDAVLRARAEWLSARQRQLEAGNGVAQAGRYLNFLLNRPLDTVIESAALSDAISNTAAEPGLAADAGEQALRARPELQQLTLAETAARAQLRAAHSTRLPSLALGVDAGTQGADYGFGRNYNYISGSLLFNWTVFDGNARSAAISRARLNAQQLHNQREQGESRIELEVRQAQDLLRVSMESLATAGARAEAAHAALRIAARKRDEGSISQAEFLDASNTLTSADLNLNWTRFDLLQRRADLVYASGVDASPLPGVSP